MILIKLGGSIITNKGKPESARRKTIDNILKQIKKINEPKILVHGGGSYGHYWSVKYGMHTKPARYSLKGLSVVKNSMIELNKIILDSATKNTFRPDLDILVASVIFRVIPPVTSIEFLLIFGFSFLKS